MSTIEQGDSRELRLVEIRKEAEEKGSVTARGIRAVGAPLPVASPQTGYYGQPMLKEPQWTPLIPFYFFVGGATGSLGMIGSLADVIGSEQDLARTARWMALGGITLSSILLIGDLGRPSRFLHMLRVFKPKSTMSMGSWILSAFSTSVSVSSFSDLLAMRFKVCWPIRLISATGRMGCVLFGMPFHNYTGVLIGATAVPVWNHNVRALPRIFGMSGLQSAVGLLELAGHDNSMPLNALALIGASVESWDFLALLQSKDQAQLPARQGLAGRLLQTAAVLSGPLPIALRLAALFACKKRKHKQAIRKIAAVSGILGSLCMRYGWMSAGKTSSRDWRLPLQIEDNSLGNLPDASGRPHAIRDRIDQKKDS